MRSVKDRIRIAQVKVVPVKGDLAANHARLMAVLQRLPKGPLDMVVTPECFLDGYVATEMHVTRRNISQFAVDPATDPYVSEVARWARERRTWLILGCSRHVAGGVSNSALVFDRRGRCRGTYDKVHCQTHDRKFVPGNRLDVFRSDFGPFGVMICADRRWPETVRTLALKGARILFNPTYGMHDQRNLWMMRIRSYESEVFIAFTHPQQALVTGPVGQILTNQIHRNARFSLCDIHLGEVNEVRNRPSAHLRDRRPDVYEL